MIYGTSRVYARVAILTILLWVGSGAMAGSTPRRISGEHEGNCFNPVLSPDGKRVAYEVNYFERREIELFDFDLAAGSEKQIRPSKGGSAILSNFGVQAGGQQVTYEIAWWPTRPDMYVFASSGGDENYDIYLSGGGLLASDPAADGMAAWSSDGKYLAFTSSRTGEGDIYLIDIAKTEEAPAQLTSFTDSTEWYASWNPKGSDLLFVRHEAKGGDNIYLLKNVTGKGEPLALTRWKSIQTKPSWSPDGSRIAFYSNHKVKERYDLYMMEPKAGATPTMIMQHVQPNDRLGPTWLPDGSGILVVKEDPERFNPIRLINVKDPTKVKIVGTGTQNNGDIQLVKDSTGAVKVAFVAQGRIGDSTKIFKRVYVMTLEPADLKF